jgi:hypothetical protein
MTFGQARVAAGSRGEAAPGGDRDFREGGADGRAAVEEELLSLLDNCKPLGCELIRQP